MYTFLHKNLKRFKKVHFSEKYFFAERAVKECVICICLRQCYDACLHINPPGTTPAEQCGPPKSGVVIFFRMASSRTRPMSGDRWQSRWRRMSPDFLSGRDTVYLSEVAGRPRWKTEVYVPRKRRPGVEIFSEIAQYFGFFATNPAFRKISKSDLSQNPGYKTRNRQIAQFQLFLYDCL